MPTMTEAPARGRVSSGGKTHAGVDDMFPREERRRRHEDKTAPAEQLKTYAKSHPDDIAALINEWLLSDNTGCSLRS